MFDSSQIEPELWAGERLGTDPLFGDGFDELCYRLSLEEMRTPRAHGDKQKLPDLETIPAGALLTAILDSTDPSKLNGFDLVRLLQARERSISHAQAGSMSDMVEISYSTPGDAHSDAARLDEAFEFASDEIRAALTLTRRAAESRLAIASEIKERLPRVWHLLSEGLIDLSRAKVFVDGTSHLEEGLARQIVDQLAAEVPHLTTGQLRARIRRLCIDTDPEDAMKREDRAQQDRRLWIEPTLDGTANLHLFDIAIDDAGAIGRRVNAHMISLQKSGDLRSHDQLRADITVDLLMGKDPTNDGRGLVDIRVDLTTLLGLDGNSAEIPGIGPVVAEVARRVADRQHRAEWRFVVADEEGRVLDIVTPRRRPTTAMSRQVEALQPTCSFPGCRMPAGDCDFDHLLPWSEGGQTSVGNGGPKCRHDHRLKDNGWAHQHLDAEDIWTSPLGHTYVTQGQSP